MRIPHSIQRTLFCTLLILLVAASAWSQGRHKTKFTRADTLRGAITPERAWWDMVHCALEVKVDPENKSIVGKNTLTYIPLAAPERMQIDLQAPMEIEKIEENGKKIEFEREGDVVFVTLEAVPAQGEKGQLSIFYQGKPRVARNPPWDGGFTWRKDKNGDYFIATACQSLGASSWWPLKDHPYDEPDSLSIAITVPKKLMAVANGRLRSVVKNKDKTQTYTWAVTNPINAYGVNINIGNYEVWEKVYPGEKGPLDCSFYVLKDNLKKAQEHFEQVDKMLAAFEHWFGPYPFYEDGYKLVEVPYLGMEHQSSVTYGNRYKMGYLGRDLSLTGHGLKFDYIIIHESGHEWFANNITYADKADFWLHEGFTNYSESLFLEYHFGKAIAYEYVRGIRMGIQNRHPLISNYGVNQMGGHDSYAKGANILHTLRQILNDDEAWRQILRGINREFYHQTVTSAEIEQFINAGIPHYDTGRFFDQYLRDPRKPKVETEMEDQRLKLRFTDAIDGFEMPLRVKVGETWQEINVKTGEWSSIELEDPKSRIEFDLNYYVQFDKAIINGSN